MNVIVICLDTLRRDALGCYNASWVRTPNIDAFAKRAARFMRAYAGSFPTIPMRTDCFTGGCNFPRYGWSKLRDDDVLLSECMQAAGYRTGLITDTTHMIPAGFARGFHDVHVIQRPPENTTQPEDIAFPAPPENMRNNGADYQSDMANAAHFKHEEDWFVARTMRTACKWLRKHRAERFFLWVDSFEIHETWHTPQRYIDMYDPGYEGVDYPYPNYGYTKNIYKPEELKHLRARYAAEVTLTDRWVGELLREIERLGLFENTMVVLMSDHGMAIGEHGRCGKHTVVMEDPWPMYEEVAGIPLLVSVPGMESGRRVRALVQPADLMPTILDACSVDGPYTYGQPWMPFLDWDCSRNWPYIFSSRNNWGDPGASRVTVTSRRWCYIVAESEPVERPGMLFDLRKDRAQHHDVIKKDPKRARKMHRAFIEFMRKSGAEEGYVQKYATA